MTLYSLISYSEGSIVDALGDVLGKYSFNGDIIFSSRFSNLSSSTGNDRLQQGDCGIYSAYSIMVN